MGTLFLPSLTEKKFHKISDVTLEEATNFMKDFTQRIVANHKIKNTGNATHEPTVYHGLIDLDSFDESIAEDIASSIKIANTPGVRGARAVYVEENGTFAVGTTVVYNRNWATIGFDDDTILDTLRGDWNLTIDAKPNDPNDDQHTSWYDSNCSVSPYTPAWHSSSC